MPYPSGLQGNGLPFKVSDNIYELNDADRIVISGGNYTGWTLFAIEYVKKLGKPFIYLELAYIGSETKNLGWHQPSKALMSSEYSASIVSEVWDVETIKVVGSPQLDFVPELLRQREGRELNNRVLVYSSVSSPDGLTQLKSVVSQLVEAGYQIEVRNHPREDVKPWIDMGAVLSDRSQSLTESLLGVDYAIGVLGTFNSVLAACKIPTSVVIESSNQGAPSEFLPYTYLWNLKLEVGNNLENLLRSAAADKNSIPVTGLIGGSANRIVREILV
jgi:hypothetical protein